MANEIVYSPPLTSPAVAYVWIYRISDATILKNEDGALSFVPYSFVNDPGVEGLGVVSFGMVNYVSFYALDFPQLPSDAYVVIVRKWGDIIHDSPHVTDPVLAFGTIYWDGLQEVDAMTLSQQIQQNAEMFVPAPPPHTVIDDRPRV